MDFNFITYLKTCSDFVAYSNPVTMILYTHIPTIIISLFVGTIVFMKSRTLLGKTLFFLTSFFSLWVGIDLVVWLSTNSILTTFSWALFGLLTSTVSILCAYFFYIFLNKKDLSLKDKILYTIPILPIIFLTPTVNNILNFDMVNCEAIDSIVFVTYYYIVSFASMIMILLTFAYGYRKIEKIYKKEVWSMFVSLEIFLLLFLSLGYIASYFDNYSIEFYGLFGMVIFMSFLAYIIVRFKAFNIKMIGAQALVWALVILIGSEFLFVTNLTNQILVAFTLIVSAILGLILVRSVRKEIIQRERIELLATDLQKANDRLTELNIQKSEFVSFATHQLRAPLTAMKGYASLVLEGDTGPVTDAVKNAVSRIFDSAKTLASIVDDYLNITRIELGTMKYSFDTVDLKSLVEDVMAEVKPNIDASKAKFEFTAQNNGTDYRITADRDKLKQVISNLVDNSIKYTPSGNVWVNLSRDAKTKKIVFEVKDTGIGIAPETLPHLFAKFTRAGNANKTNIKGTGLGLYVAKEIVNSHHGNIFAESAGEGKGSRFVVELEPWAKL